MDKYVIKQTSDGSNTIYLPELDETYHSVHGAIQEARHVFLRHGLNHFAGQTDLNILEVGLGTGLNALLTLLEAQKINQMIHYTAIEAKPLDEQTIALLNYQEAIGLTEEECGYFNRIHQSPWEDDNRLTSFFNFRKHHVSIQDFKTDDSVNLIFFDAFGPRVQPEMWEEGIFRKLYQILTPGGVLVTYCAKGSVKRTLKAVGFDVEALPGPPGKREMTRAMK
ncbi:MAG: tRNA (5-methylaminomethyl-2-thiouridine)(34)-methyltransferase MnmD [Flavobacteriales bacterium]|nr:tRNA (5-methylaminomethyl-2-thiouridine)(34)-methyltransferase MnmD [Flavobacteriales bacterium]